MAYFLRKESVNGITNDELISWLQKSIRRGDIDSTMVCVSELDNSGYGNAAFNRLRIIASEDIGIGNSYGLGVVLRGREEWIKCLMKTQKCTKSRIKYSKSHESKPARRVILSVAKYLAESHVKSRICANSISLSLLISNGFISREDVMDIRSRQIEELDEVVHENLRRIIDIDFFKMLSKKTNFFKAVIAFFYYIDIHMLKIYEGEGSRDEKAISYDECESRVMEFAILIYVWNQIATKDQKKKNEALYFIFDNLIIIADKHEEIINNGSLKGSDANLVLDCKNCFNIDGNNLHLFHAILITSRILRQQNYVNYDITEEFDISEIEKGISQDMANEIYVKKTSSDEVPDHVLDKHTYRGKNLKRDMKHFFEVGALLNFKGHPIHNPYRERHEKLYMVEEAAYGTRKARFRHIKKRKHDDFEKGLYTKKRKRDREEQMVETKNKKQKPSEGLLEVDVFVDPVRAQIRCGKKPDAFFCFYEGVSRFVKGPFKNEKYAKIQYLSDKIKNYLALNVVNVEYGRFVPNEELFGDDNVRGHEPVESLYLICDDLSNYIDCGVKIKNSKTYNNVKVVDFDSDACKCGPISIDKFEQLQDEYKEKSYFQLLIVLVYRYCFEISDTCCRNILLDKQGLIYSVDENNMFTGKKNYLFSKKPSKAWNLFIGNILEDEELFLCITQTCSKWSEKITSLLGDSIEVDEMINLKHLIKENKLLNKMKTVINHLDSLKNKSKWEELLE